MPERWDKNGNTSSKWQNHLLATGRGRPALSSYIVLDVSLGEPQEYPELWKLKCITQITFYPFSELVSAQLVQGK